MAFFPICSSSKNSNILILASLTLKPLIIPELTSVPSEVSVYASFVISPPLITSMISQPNLVANS